ncbi:MAG: M56 family metallopeptidase, partial [Anaerovoracaceae bacterium]
LSMENMACPVYVTESIETPCLFGFFKPVIYVTPEVAEDSRTLRYAVEHEMSHYRQKDPLWSLLRGICLILQWFNPLVWAAAVLSKNDCELACDAATIRRLGEEERADYGRTLIEMTRPGRNVLLLNATTMTGSRHALKERIEMIAKKPKMAVYTLIVVLLVAAAAVLVTFTGAKNDGFYQWLQSVETENVSDAVMTVYHENGQSRQHLSKQNTVDDLIQILHTIEKNDLKEVDIDGNTGEAQLCLGMYFEESELPQPQNCIFKLTSDGKIQMLFDKNTADSYCRTGKTWQIDNTQLTEYFTVMMTAMEDGTTDLMSFLKTVQAADFDRDYLIGNVSFEELAEVLNQVTEGELITTPEQLETQYWQYWQIDAFLKASPEEEDSDEEPRRQIYLSCGLEENLVEIEYYSGAGASERMVFHDETLYQLVRHARDYAETVDPEAYAKFENILVPQMEFHRKSMSEANPGIYDYELTMFCQIGAYEEEDGSRVELYDFDYALLTDDVESIVWAGGMRLDSQCRIHGFNGGGQFAVRYRGGKVAATAFMGNDFGVSSADFENKEAQKWIKERLKSALDQAE